jgi:hypothetical protein
MGEGACFVRKKNAFSHLIGLISPENMKNINRCSINAGEGRLSGLGFRDSRRNCLLRLSREGFVVGGEPSRGGGQASLVTLVDHGEKLISAPDGIRWILDSAYAHILPPLRSHPLPLSVPRPSSVAFVP